MNVDHWMNFGSFAEQAYFVYPAPGTYKGVVVNANMVAYAPTGIAAFLMEKTDGKLKYMIDPQTHAFQHEPSAVKSKNPKTGEENVKLSIRKMAESYGSPVAERVGIKPLLPEDLSDDSVLEPFVQRCLEFQRDTLSTEMEKSDANKYIAQSRPDLEPHALMSPYFYITESSGMEWLTVCERACKFAIKHKKESKLFMPIVLSQGALLNDKIRTAVSNTFSVLDLDGFAIWIDNLDEHTAGSTDLIMMTELVRALSSSGQEVINLHGGYFSILCSAISSGKVFTAVAHGPEYGESRAVVPVGGGIPVAKYYVPKLHLRMKYRDALYIFQQKGLLSDASKFHSDVCGCEECQYVIDGDIANFRLFGDSSVKRVKRKGGWVRMEFSTSDAKCRCLKHYLQIKKKEYSSASTMSKEDAVDYLEQTMQTAANGLGVGVGDYLSIWRDVLKTL